ncbi:unnamed protein product [Paramecium sonneborni]|uniref:Transmembrane protein n=1 Tax=Paramecium sonneborni TaxID=65129 RepID=A0A8S1RQV0_9CILI|nr:unnamed protein product [Paramecium sonneborni]
MLVKDRYFKFNIFLEHQNQLNNYQYSIKKVETLKQFQRNEQIIESSQQIQKKSYQQKKKKHNQIKQSKLVQILLYFQIKIQIWKILILFKFKDQKFEILFKDILNQLIDLIKKVLKMQQNKREYQYLRINRWKHQNSKNLISVSKLFWQYCKYTYMKMNLWLLVLFFMLLLIQFIHSRQANLIDTWFWLQQFN